VYQRWHGRELDGRAKGKRAGQFFAHIRKQEAAFLRAGFAQIVFEGLVVDVTFEMEGGFVFIASGAKHGGDYFPALAS